jgi:hypothetical protein
MRPDNPPDSPEQVTAAPQSAERRRLLRGGLATAPVLMTIASRPVLGQTACVAPSALGSMPASGNHAVSVCSGLSPEQWNAVATQWPSPYVGLGDGADPGFASQPTESAASTPSTSITSYRSGSTHGVTIGSRELPPHLSGSPSTSSLIAQSSSGVPTGPVMSSRPATSTSAPAAAGAISAAPSHGVTIGSRQVPSYQSRYAPPPSAPADQSQSTTTPSQASAAPGTAFHCPTTGLGGNVYGDMTMLDVINADSSGDGLGRYIVAALLNARAGRTPVLTEFTVRNMWNDLHNRGYYEPTAAVRWGSSQIVAYIKTTIG